MRGREVVDSGILMEGIVLGLGVAERDLDIQVEQYARNKTNESPIQPQHIRDFDARSGKTQDGCWNRQGRGSMFVQQQICRQSNQRLCVASRRMRTVTTGPF
jgi:hypothetical protein